MKIENHGMQSPGFTQIYPRTTRTTTVLDFVRVLVILWSWRLLSHSVGICQWLSELSLKHRPKWAKLPSLKETPDMDGWKTILLPFWDSAYFQGQTASVSFREGRLRVFTIFPQHFGGIPFFISSSFWRGNAMRARPKNETCASRGQFHFVIVTTTTTTSVKVKMTHLWYKSKLTHVGLLCIEMSICFIHVLQAWDLIVLAVFRKHLNTKHVHGVFPA